MKKVFLIVCIAVLALGIAAAANCADNAKSAPAATPMRRPMPPQFDKNFTFVVGTVSKVDASNPNGAKIEVAGEVDNKAHTVEVGPGTNILKVIDIAELKPGEKVRIMAKKTDNKEVAMSVVTGKFKEMPRPKPMPMSDTTPIAKQETVKK